jgi:hypothetical protein
MMASLGGLKDGYQEQGSALTKLLVELMDALMQNADKVSFFCLTIW